MAKFVRDESGMLIALPDANEADLKAAEQAQGGAPALDYSPEVGEAAHTQYLQSESDKEPMWRKAVEGFADAATLGQAKPWINELAVSNDPSLAGTRFMQDSAARQDMRSHTAPFMIGEAAGFLSGAGLMGPVDAIGAVAERAAARAIPEATSLMGKLATSGAKLAVRGGVENAIIQTSMDASRRILHNDPVTIESLAASAGSGALWGAGLGAVGGIAAEGLSQAASRYAERFGQSSNLREVLSGAGVSERRIAEMTEKAGGTEQLYSQIKTVMQEGNISSVKDLLSRAKDASASLGKTATETAKAAESLGLDWSNIKGRVGARIMEEGGDAASRAQAVAEAKIARIDSLEGYMKFRGDLMASKSAAVRPVLSIVDGEVRSALETAAGAAGKPELAEKFLSAVAAKSTADSLAKAAMNVDQVRKAAGSTIGAMDMGLAGAAAMAGHPVAALGALARGTVSNEIKAAMSNAVFDMGMSGKLESAVNGIKELLKNTGSKFVSTTAGSKKVYTSSVAAYEKAMANYQNMASPASRTTMSHDLDQVARINPDVAKGIVAVRDRAVEYLSTVAPPSRAIAASVGLLKEPKRVSLDNREHAFTRAYNAITDPKSVIAAIGAGTASKDEVAALKAVYPALYQETLDSVMTAVSEKKASGHGFGMSKIVQLSILMGAPVDSTVSPEMIGIVQDYHAATNTPQEGMAPQNKPGGQMSGQTMTKTEKMEM